MTTASAFFGRSPTPTRASDAGRAEMPKIASLLTLICVLTQWGATASAQTCEYAGQTFSPGSTVCECPNLRIVRSANSAGRGEITSRRLACSKDQSWVNTNSLCLVAYTSADHAEDAFRKFQASYCPRLPVNHAELLKAISEETEKFFSLARGASPCRPRACTEPGISRSAGQDHRTVRGRGADGRGGSAHCAQAVGKVRPAVLHREHGRGWRQSRYGRRRPGAGRRLHDPVC